MIKNYSFLILISIVLISCGSEEKKPRTRLSDSSEPIKEKFVENTKESETIPRKKNPFEIPKPPISSTVKREPNIENIKITVNVNKYKERRTYWDYDAKPDVFGLITFSSGDVVAIPFTKNSFVAGGIAENVSLEKGDSVFVFLRDKDIDGFEIIDETVFVYNGYRYFTQRLGKSRVSFAIKRKRK